MSLKPLLPYLWHGSCKKNKIRHSKQIGVGGIKGDSAFFVPVLSGFNTIHTVTYFRPSLHDVVGVQFLSELHLDRFGLKSGGYHRASVSLEDNVFEADIEEELEQGEGVDWEFMNQQLH